MIRFKFWSIIRVRDKYEKYSLMKIKLRFEFKILE